MARTVAYVHFLEHLLSQKRSSQGSSLSIRTLPKKRLGKGVFRALVSDTLLLSAIVDLGCRKWVCSLS